mmetsp:Transcript_11916/g.21811  ORF Transcript_11916/g.21811 Transcript_11916/m.21811 type:complete len:272 (+) Transcript_11916:66-881(+)
MPIMAKQMSQLFWLAAVQFQLAAADFVKMGDGQCNGGVGGHGDHYCLHGGACNEGGTPSQDPTLAGVTCPGEAEYLLCEESASVDHDVCKAACEADGGCVGFMISSNLGGNDTHIGASRCELHTTEITTFSDPLECYSYESTDLVGSGDHTFVKLGNGPCRTKALTEGGPQAGTFYGNMTVAWVATLEECQGNCSMATSPACVGVEWHSTPNENGNKCELHHETLGKDQMVEFACWVKTQAITSRARQTYAAWSMPAALALVMPKGLMSVA